MPLVRADSSLAVPLADGDRDDGGDKRVMTLMTETAPAGQINQVELGASDVLLAKRVGVDHLSPAFNQ